VPKIYAFRARAVSGQPPPLPPIDVAFYGGSLASAFRSAAFCEQRLGFDLVGMADLPLVLICSFPLNPKGSV